MSPASTIEAPATVGARPPLSFAIAIHGGAGIVPEQWTAAERAAHLESLTVALTAGRDLLAAGAAALDVVEAVVRILEDDPLFNAGRGSVFNSQGNHELDAAVMDGRSRQCGAVAAVRSVKNPISLARLVMSETRHVLLVGDGAEHFAETCAAAGRIETVSNEYFSTDRRHRDWLAAVERERHGQNPSASNKGTVGCVVRDSHGNLAAGTSTGGVTNKKFGRVGDTPVIGAGTYADNATCAVSCTGTGEYFIRHVAAFQISAWMALSGMTLPAAAHRMIDEVLPHDVGGLIAVAHDGTLALPFNTAGMSRGAADSSGRFEVSLGR